MSLSTVNSLGALPKGSYANVLIIEGGQRMKARLCSMGIMPGVLIKVLANNGNGPVIIKIMGCQIVLGRTMATRVRVRKSDSRIG